MADGRTFLSRIGGMMQWGKGSPIDRGSPEDEGGSAPLDQTYSRSPESLLLIGPGTDRWIKAIAVNNDTILRREGSQDLRLYDALLDDDVAMSTLQQRRLAITSRDWEVAPGDEDDPRSVQAADDFRDMLKEAAFDRATGLLHFTLWFGYGIGEYLWTTKVHNGRRIIWLDDILVPDRRWFGFTIEGELRFTAAFGSLYGEEVPVNKFVAIRTGGTHDFAFYGLGLAHWCYWAIWFKRAVTRFWALYLEKYSQPTALGEFEDAAGEGEKRTLLDALLGIGRDSAVIVPKGMAESIKLMEAQRSGSGASSYKDFVTEQNEAIMRIVLGQPGTSKATPQGVGGKQSEVHEDVKAEIVKADSDLICEAINGTAAVWLTRWNHGEDVAPPRVFRVLDDEEDLNTVAERDAKLKNMGIRRTDESIKEVYGEGYERVEEPVVDPATGLPRPPGQRPPAANDDEGKGKLRRAAFDAHDPAPLYVFRPLLNAAELIAWAKKQGFKTIEPAAEMHVTVLYSKEPVDWFKLGETWGPPNGELIVPPGGPRKVEALGDKGGVVLHFGNDDLAWRHRRMIEAGATHDYETFQPHVTISYDAEGVDLDAIEPFEGALRFGPERFREIEVKPDALDILGVFSADDMDEIDRLTAALMEETNPLIVEFAAQIRESLAGVTSIEGARVALLQAFERFPEERLAKAMGLPFTATRAAADAGVEEQVEA